MEKIKFITYNIHRCIGFDRVYDPERVGRVLKNLNADVIALQEVGRPKFCSRLEGGTQLEYLARTSEYDFFCGANLFTGREPYGNAVLFRGTQIEKQSLDLSFKSKEPRGALFVELEIRGVRVRVVTVHLGLMLEERRFQAKKLKNFLAHLKKMPTVILGDFNEWGKASRSLAPLHRIVNLRKNEAVRTFPARFPLFSLDKIFTQSRHHVVSLYTEQVPEAKLASDHLPLAAEICFNEHSDIHVANAADEHAAPLKTKQIVSY